MNKEDEDLSIIEKITIVLLWFNEYKYSPGFKKNGYLTKNRSRKICILIGIIFYALVIVAFKLLIF